MNLYSIDFVHYAPKDSEEGVYGYTVANSDEEVYEFIKSEPNIKGNTLYSNYKYKEDKTYHIYNDDYEVIGEETFKERMIRLKGEMNDEDADVSDSYYGVTHLGWTLVKENITEEEIQVLKNVNILNR